MGKHFWMKYSDSRNRDKQPGCIWGLAHVLGYHHSQSSNVRKRIQQHQKYQRWRNNDGYTHDDRQGEKLLQGSESPDLINGRSQEPKKRSLKARIKSLIPPEEIKNTEATKGSFKRSLQRTYSIHHLDSVDVDWKHSIVFLPGDMKNFDPQSVEVATETEAVNGDDEEGSTGRSDDHTDPTDVFEYDSKENNPDVLEMFMVDKGFLIKRLQEADESFANFSRSALGLTPRSKLNKSRPFPLPEWSRERKPKPVKLESKHKEVWSFQRKDKFQADTIPGEVTGKNTFSGVTMDKDDIQPSNEFVTPSEMGSNIVKPPLDEDSTGKKLEEHHMRKYVHRRSSSLNEAMDKYIWLFENSFPTDSKMNSCKSLKLANEYGYASEYSERNHSLSYQELEKFSFKTSRNGSLTTGNDIDSSLRYDEEQGVVGQTNVTEICDEEQDDTCKSTQVKEEEACSTMTTTDVVCERMDEGEHHLLQELDTDNIDIVCDDLPHRHSISHSDLCLREMEEHPTSEGLDHSSNIDDLKSLHSSNSPSICDALNLEIMPTFVPNRYPENNDAELHYVKKLLDESNIAVEAFEMAWHTFDQPLSMELFKKVEASWPDHEFTECGFWHHQMLFDLVNDVILDIYDASFPYYPKALSSCCHVRPFPVGNRIIEGVSTDISMLMNLRKQSLDGVIAHDLARDTSWMNLQMETECVALELEDMIFNELLEDIMHS